MSGLNPIRLGLIWRRLNGLMDEVAHTFVQASFSSVVRENWDLAFSLMNSEGRQFVQSQRSIPSFIGTMSQTLKAALDKFPANTLQPGDVLISNNPWLGAGHLNDITMLNPLFYQDRLLAFIGSTAHSVDIGGAPSPYARDCFEEGLTIPIAKIVEAGVENRTVIDFITYNLRQPEETLGDIRAQLGAYEIATRKLSNLMHDEGLENLDVVVDEILSRSERTMRKIISEIPNGHYADEMKIDGYEEPLTIACTVSIKGSDLRVDFTGTSPQIDRPMNSVMNYTYAYSCYAIQCALNSGAQNNNGSFRPITVTAPKGCLLNALHPAPVWGRHLSGHYIPAAIYSALSKVVPEKVISESGSPLWNVYFKGIDPSTGKPFVKMFFMNGGHGARPDRDGPGCLSFPSNVSNQPIEEFENQAPLLVTEKTLAPDTAGPGRFRGGPGQRISFRYIGDAPIHVLYRHERVKFPPRGLLGGKAGSPGMEMINDKRTPSKFQTTMVSGDTLTVQTPGGGGMYPAMERDVDSIASDLRSGIYGPDFVNRHYGQFNSLRDKKNA